MTFALANLKDSDFPAFDETDRKLGELIERHDEEYGPSPDKFGGKVVYERALLALGAAEAKSRTAALRRILDAAIKLSAGATPRTPSLAHIRVSVSLRRDDSGRLVVQHAGPLIACLDALQGLETRHIGHCQVCGDYFWAKRLRNDGSAPQACAAHAHALRARRYRAKHAEKDG